MIVWVYQGNFMKISAINFKGKPWNYSVIDNCLSRSAQPNKEDFIWLKEQGVTDVFNFLTMIDPGVDFNEEELVKSLGMRYHNIPTITMCPNEEKVDIFLKEMEQISKNGGKAHIHCKAGADRTGMYAYIYKSIKGIGGRVDNLIEMINMGHNLELYPDLLPWANKLINKLTLAK